MSKLIVNSRRQFVGGAAAAGGSLILSACSKNVDTAVEQKAAPAKKNGEEAVSPAEDLMREHGILNRVLLIYREGIRRIDSKEEFPPEGFVSTANLIRRFIEDYHEKLEEEHLFPRFRKADTLVELVDVLEAQHKRGRVLTEMILRFSLPAAYKNPQIRLRLRDALQRFVGMYEPHQAREDTVLFPAFRKLLSAQEYAALGEDFEDKEHQLFGEDGFEKNVEEVAGIEKSLGIYDLAQFTSSV